jgi:hypothetical protein
MEETCKLRDCIVPIRTHGSRCSCLGNSSSSGKYGAFRSNKRGGVREDEPTYENLEFHRVKISVPGHNGGRPILLNGAGTAGVGIGGGCGVHGNAAGNKRMQQTVNSRVIRNENIHRIIIRQNTLNSKTLSELVHSVSECYLTTFRRVGRVKARPVTASATTNNNNNNNNNGEEDSLAEQERKKFEKFGYSKNEVWNWLYTDKEEEELEAEKERRRLAELYSVPDKNKSKATRNKTVEVKFTPQEFFASSYRLAHLDIDGMDQVILSKNTAFWRDVLMCITFSSWATR